MYSTHEMMKLGKRAGKFKEKSLTKLGKFSILIYASVRMDIGGHFYVMLLWRYK
jgi:hypothetical protein